MIVSPAQHFEPGELASELARVAAAVGIPRPAASYADLFAAARAAPQSRSLNPCGQVAGGLFGPGNTCAAGDGASILGADPSKPDVPPEPGKSPVPPGHVRLYHYTNAGEGSTPAEEQEIIDSLAKHGIDKSKARGETYGEGNAVWASTAKPDDGKVFVEFSVPWNDPRMYPKIESPELIAEAERMGHNYRFFQSIKPTEFVAVHRPFHHHVRYIRDNADVLEETLSGKNDFIIKSGRATGQAVEFVKTHGRSLNPCGQVAGGLFGPGNTCAAGDKDAGGGWAGGKPLTEIHNDDIGPPYATDEEWRNTPEKAVAASEERRRREKAWESAMFAALSEGTITAEQAIEKGLSKRHAEKYVPLPDTLFHVTVAGDKVASDGLKTPYQRGGGGEGLGGGDDHAVSLTTSERVARGIFEGMLEAKDVLDGKIKPADMIAEATAGGWVSELEKWSMGYSGQSLAQVYGGDPRVSVETPDDAPGRSAGFAPQSSVDPTWKPIGKIITDADGVQLSNRWARPATPAEAREQAFNLYRAHSLHRETKTGKYDPFFAFNDLEAFAAIPREQIRVFKATPASPEAKGEKRNPVEAEYRIASGKAVKLEPWSGQ